MAQSSAVQGSAAYFLGDYIVINSETPESFSSERRFNADVSAFSFFYDCSQAYCNLLLWKTLPS
jgi:hypothetical protein